MLYSKLKTMNSVRSNSLSLELTPSVCKDIRIRKSEFVATTQFICTAAYTIVQSAPDEISLFEKILTSFS